ncbi:MAG: GFA family protein [Propylenella sp.]
MTSSPEIRITGGCQCGAVRYALHAQPDNPHICHCRMCQKAFGSFFAPLTGVPLTAFELTRGALSIFKSSDPTERGFCANCGTPLTIHDVDSLRIAVSIGSLDRPENVPPLKQYGIEGRLSWFATLPSLPGDKTTEADNPELAAKIAASNHQHPDHDTAEWRPVTGGSRWPTSE